VTHLPIVVFIWNSQKVLREIDLNSTCQYFNTPFSGKKTETDIQSLLKSKFEQTWQSKRNDILFLRKSQLFNKTINIDMRSFQTLLFCIYMLWQLLGQTYATYFFTRELSPTFFFRLGSFKPRARSASAALITTLLLLLLLLLLFFLFLVDRYSWYLKYQLVFKVTIGIWSNNWYLK
jgi:hypothetical protein